MCDGADENERRRRRMMRSRGGPRVCVGARGCAWTQWRHRVVVSLGVLCEKTATAVRRGGRSGRMATRRLPRSREHRVTLESLRCCLNALDGRACTYERRFILLTALALLNWPNQHCSQLSLTSRFKKSRNCRRATGPTQVPPVTTSCSHKSATPTAVAARLQLLLRLDLRADSLADLTVCREARR